MTIKATIRREDKPRSGIALGGLGTGSFEIRADGIFRNWSIFNNAPLALGAHFPLKQQSLLFFVVRYQEEGKPPQMRLLQVEESHDAATFEHHQHHYIFPWLDGVDRIDSDMSFPTARLTFRDAGMPFLVEMEAWSPFIPHDARHSSLPAALFDFKITALTRKPVKVMLMASFRNAVGYDVPDRTYVSRLHEGDQCRIAEVTCEGMPMQHASAGTMALASLAGDSSYYLGWEHLHPYYETALRQERLPDVDDTEGRNPVDKSTGRRRAMERCFSTVAVSRSLGGRTKAFEHTFALTWHFPNRYAQSAQVVWPKAPAPADHIEGHYYDAHLHTAAGVAAYVREHLDDLRRRTKTFQGAFFESSLPACVLDQVNSQLNTLVTSSWFTKAGFFGIVEGIDPEQSFAGLNTLDVMMYGGVMVAALFPELDRETMRAYARLQSDNGCVAHSISRNLRELPAGETNGHRVDLPGQFAFLALRAYFMSGDRAYLDTVWPSVRKAIEYVLRERDRNGDGMPDMEGIMCSYDNFPMYGVSSFVAAQWLAALGLAVKAARVVGDSEAADRYAALVERGRRVFEERLWNGRYYRLCNDEGGAKGIIDEGCLSDQLLGQWAANLAGLGRLFEARRIRSALRHVLKVNFRADQGLRNCSWPGDGYLHEIGKDTWVDQANTCWTGTELAFAALAIQEGLYAEGLKVIRNIDERYRHWGMYWDHQEFGGHYYRPLSGWSIITAALGFVESEGVVTFDPKVPAKRGQLLWVGSSGYGHYSPGARRAVVSIASGVLQARQLRIRVPDPKVKRWSVVAGKTALAAALKEGFLVIDLPEEVRLSEGTRIVVQASR